MGVRTGSLDMIAAMRREAADRAKREEAARVVERWNKAIAAGRDMWWSPTGCRGRASYRRAIDEWRCSGSAIANRGRAASRSSNRGR
jgi:hypothetical protein